MPSFNWRDPLFRAIEIVYTVVLDAGVIVAYAGIATAAERTLTLFNSDGFTWDYHGYSLTLKEIVHNGDLAAFLVFMVVAFGHIIQWAWKR